MPDEYGSNETIDNNIRLTGVDPTLAKAQDTGPVYRVFKESKIPVAKAHGKLWESRIAQARTSRSDIEDCWREAVRYYDNDQMSHRGGNGSGTRSGATRYKRLLTKDWAETENVIFSNAVTMLPLLYAKNPSVEITASDPKQNEKFAHVVERLVNTLLVMKEAPGLNLKTKARRGVLGAYLMNSSYLKIDWVRKEDSSQAALEELAKLTDELTNAKNQKEVKAVEGKIAAIEDKVSFLSPAGPRSELIAPFRIYIDPAALEPDHSDANWIGEETYIMTSYLNAVFGVQDGEETRSVYEPTHILRANASAGAIDDEINSFSLFNKSDEGSAYGYNNTGAFRAAQYTKVWYIWDKTTRRVYLYADNDWCWPLWVWDDPLKLLRFYPYFRLWFHETPEGSQPKGEVTYILDQQDAINDINSEIARARNWARFNVFFDSNKISQQAVEDILKGPDGTARGIDIPEGGKLQDAIQSIVPPGLAHPDLFSTDSRFAAINRITGISDAQRGAQFKTNTTNDAIDAYQKNVDIRVDEKIDAIEDWIGDYAWALAQLLVMNWTADDVRKLLGDEAASNWKQIADPQLFRSTLNMRVVGGSTDKPTSKTKKQQALQIGQVLGQFGNGIPAIGVVLLKIFERAFQDDFVMTDEDWSMIMKSMEDTTNKAGAGPGGAGGEQGGGGGDPGAQKAQIAELIAKLPPEAKQKMQQLIARGASPTDALKQIMQEIQAAHGGQDQGGGQQPPQQAPQPAS